MASASFLPDDDVTVLSKANKVYNVVFSKYCLLLMLFLMCEQIRTCMLVSMQAKA